MNQQNNDFDFGFTGEEYEGGGALVVPYCQFLNSSSNLYGLAVTERNAGIAGFSPDDTWQQVEHEFGDGEPVQIWYTTQPRMAVINKSGTLMSDGMQTIAYNYDLRERDRDRWKVFTYLIVWLLDKNNQPITNSPLRLKCSGSAGYSINHHFDNYKNPKNFLSHCLAIYGQLTGRSIGKNGIEVFRSHLIYQPVLQREKVTSSYNNQSSMAVVIKGFVEPTTSNFPQFIIKNGSEFSQALKEQIEATKPWLKVINENNNSDNASGNDEELDSFVGSNGSAIEPDPLDFNNHTPAPNPGQVSVTSVQESLRENKGNEFADQIRSDAFGVLQWTKPGLNEYLKRQYKTSLEQLDSLDESKLIEIYNAIQNEGIRDLFCNSPSQDPIPF